MSGLIYHGKLRGKPLGDAIHAILRDAEGFPISTGEIALRLGTYRLYGRPHRCPACTCEPLRDLGERNYQASNVLSRLKSLERRGTVERFKPEGHRKHYWRLCVVFVSSPEEADRG